jgi:hypothetical protein
VLIPAVLAVIKVPPGFRVKLPVDPELMMEVPKSTVAPGSIAKFTILLRVPPEVNVCVPVPLKLMILAVVEPDSVIVPEVKMKFPPTFRVV